MRSRPSCLLIRKWRWAWIGIFLVVGPAHGQKPPQPQRPLEPQGLLDFMEALHKEGISVADINLMTKTNPALAFGLLHGMGFAGALKELGLPPGPMYGEILRTLLDEVVEDPTLNERESLLDRARAIVYASG